MPLSPLEEYSQRLRARQLHAARFDKVHMQLGNMRLGLAVATAVAAWLSLGRHSFSFWWLLMPIATFAGIAVYHSSVLKARACAERAASVYREGLNRIEDRWAGTRGRGERFYDPHHIYAADLDIFGEGSLFELLSIARTRIGEDTLAHWLLFPSKVASIHERHQAVVELRTQLDLREDVAVLSQDSQAGVHPEALLKWAETPNRFTQQWLRWLAVVLALLAAASAIAWAMWDFKTPFLAIVVVEASILFAFRKPIDESLAGTEKAFEDLNLLSALLARLESEDFHSPRLQALMEQLSFHHLKGSQAIARLSRIVQYIESRDNWFLRILNVPLMYSLQVAFAAEAWRSEHGKAVRSWLNAIGEIEALLSIAAFSYEHPENPFPEFIEGPASFHAEELGHPLIPLAKCVRNTVSIVGATKALIVSGSNMSGKSTLLRAVGVNTVLAMAGAPVRAQRLLLTPLQIGASIAIHDSLQEGNSRFYTEITRLRQIYDLADNSPTLLFLLDELLQGTNSSDRRIGAEGVVRALMDRGAIGLISTHDLSLTEIGGIEDHRLHNVHLQDELEDGRMKFDFKLREGVVTKSNGLELMRSIGLKV